MQAEYLHPLITLVVRIRVHNDQEDSLQFHADKELLDAKRIVSQAKSTFGITMISVKEIDVETACSVLGSSGISVA